MVYRMLYRQYYHPRTAWRRTAFSRYKILQQDCWRNPFSVLFLGAGKLCDMLENYIGISCSLQNPNRHNLVRVFPDEWTLPWMRPAETEKKKQNSEKRYSTGGKHENHR